MNYSKLNLLDYPKFTKKELRKKWVKETLRVLHAQKLPRVYLPPNFISERKEKIIVQDDGITPALTLEMVKKEANGCLLYTSDAADE